MTPLNDPMIREALARLADFWAEYGESGIVRGGDAARQKELKQALVTALCAWQRAQDVAEIRKYADAFDNTFPEDVGSDLSRGRRLAADHLEALK